MVSIDTYNACVDFPIFDAKSRSLKTVSYTHLTLPTKA